MLPDSVGCSSASLRPLEAEHRRLWAAGCQAAKRTTDPEFGFKLLSSRLRFRARMPLLCLVSWAGLLDSQGRLLDPLREMRRLVNGAEQPR